MVVVLRATRILPLMPTRDATSLTARLIDLLDRPIRPIDRRRAAMHWLDWVGCVAAGARSPVVTAIAQYASPLPPIESPGAGVGERPGSRGVSHQALLGPATDGFHELLLDAGPANIEEMDDMHREAILHPGPVIVPTLAALIRRKPYSIAEVLDALLCGYEVMIRIGRGVGPEHYRYWHTTATAGAFGAAAAAARLLGLDRQQTLWALGNAGTQAAGLWQVRLEPVMSKQLHTAHAAWAGLQSAALARGGFTGPSRILEGELGFLAALCRSGADPQRIVCDEPDWLVHQTSFKPWPACRHTHAVIDAVLALRAREGDSELAFEACRVATFADAVAICDCPAPRTRTEAKFSLQYCVAAAARFGELSPEHFDEAVVSDPAMQAAAARVSLHADAELSADYPRHYGASVTLRTAASGTITHAERDSLGDPERPMSDRAIRTKAHRSMLYGGVSPKRIAEVLEAASVLGDVGASDAVFPEVLVAPLMGAG